MPAQTRQEWLDARKSYLGASDVGKLLLDQNGHPIHPYGTPHEVWLDKMGLGTFIENERTLMGQLLEPIVCKRFQLSQPGVALRMCPTVAAPGGQPWHQCNPDRLIVPLVRQIPGTMLVEKASKKNGGLRAICQIKTAGFFGAQKFGEAGSDEVPDWYLAQVQWELYCTGRDIAVLGLLHDTHLYRQFVIYRDDSLVGILKNVVDQFWTRYVITGEEPPALGHAADTEWLNHAYSPKPDLSVTATDHINEHVEKLGVELGRQEYLEKMIEMRKNTIKQFMGDARALQTSMGEITWGANKHGVRSLRLASIKVPYSPKPKQEQGVA